MSKSYAERAFSQLRANWPRTSELYTSYARIALARPQPFEHWECYAFACLARIHYTLESVFLLDDREADCASLTRVLYEHVVAFAWLMIEPHTHYTRLISWEHTERQRLAADLARFDPDGATADDVTLSLLSVGMDPSVPAAPATFDRTLQADSHWAVELPDWMFHFRRSYASLFRSFSAYVHPSSAGLSPFFDINPDFDPGRPRLDDSLGIPTQGLVMFGDALRIASASLGWPPAEEVRAAVYEGLLDEEAEGA